MLWLCFILELAAAGLYLLLNELDLLLACVLMLLVSLEAKIILELKVTKPTLQ